MKIQSGNVVVEFSNSASEERMQPKKLDRITIKKLNGGVLKQILFHYSYGT
jgi:hypothetical protein